jgi:hypothetical protein
MRFMPTATVAVRTDMQAGCGTKACCAGKLPGLQQQQPQSTFGGASLSTTFDVVTTTLVCFVFFGNVVVHYFLILVVVKLDIIVDKESELCSTAAT